MSFTLDSSLRKMGRKMFNFKLARNLTLVSFVLFNLSLFAADEAVEEIVVTG